MRTIAIINQKGGCGKTTTAINLSALLSRQGRRTLLIDLDPQSHCAVGMGIPEQRVDMDIGDAMLAAGNKPIDSSRLLWKPMRHLDLAPSRMRLAGLEAPRGMLSALPDKERRVTEVINALGGGYDIICIDCAPSIGLLTYNALVAADVVLIPVETSFFSLQGATRQVNTVKTLARKLGIHRPVWILPTIHDDGNPVARDLLAELHRRFGERVIPVVIRRDTHLREAASFGQAIVDYAPASSGCADYTRLAEWVATHWQVHGQVEAAIAESMASLIETDNPGEPDTYEPAQPAGAPGTAPGTVPWTNATAAPASSVGGEPKPLSRAEDVARRAQMLRRIALGRQDVPVQAAPPSQPVRSASEAPIAATSALGTTPSDNSHRAASSMPAVPIVAINPATPRVLGVQESNQGTLFVQPISVGSTVAVCGTFNNWSPTQHAMRANPEAGVYEVCLRLPPGKHHYRILVDGIWSADPYNDLCEFNPFGEPNSVVLVGQQSSAGGAATAPRQASSNTQPNTQEVGQS
jgi:chromosome partitioning protein